MADIERKYPFKVGRLSCRTGPMFAGKSTWVSRQAWKRDAPLLKPIITVAATDNVVTHDSSSEEDNDYSIYFIEDITSLPTKLEEEIMRAKSVCIDECQFFPVEALITAITQLREKEIDVYCAFLSGTFQQKTWAVSGPLLAIADDFQLLTARCTKCGERAPYSLRIDDNQSIIGINDHYTPVCATCLYLMSEEKKN